MVVATNMAGTGLNLSQCSTAAQAALPSGCRIPLVSAGTCVGVSVPGRRLAREV